MNRSTALVDARVRRLRKYTFDTEDPARMERMRELIIRLNSRAYVREANAARAHAPNEARYRNYMM